jgi:hypothetical protein
LVIVTFIYVGFSLLGFGLEALLERNLVGLPEAIAFGWLLLPTVVGSVLAVVVSFAVVLRLRSQDTVSATFD